ncbi:MAG TPA: hypothetical protein VF472_06445 [Burkholderiaceae bacterium]
MGIFAWWDVTEKWGVDFDEAWQACLDNLRARRPDPASAVFRRLRLQCL